MNVSKLKTKTKELKVLERDPQRNAERILILKAQVVEDSEIVTASKTELKKHRARMGRLAKTMRNVELKVFYYKYVRKYGLKNIAKKMGYSHSHIKRISAKLSKKLQDQADER
jgi:DNA-directed RNA polymerase specialized sigma subunit